MFRYPLDKLFSWCSYALPMACSGTSIRKACVRPVACCSRIRCGRSRSGSNIGNSSYILPWSIRPAHAFLMPPHCLKENGILAARHCLRMDTTHSFSIGRAPGPLSPPTITQDIPLNSSRPRSSNNGSIDRNRTEGIGLRLASPAI